MVTLLFFKVPLYFKWKCTHRNMNSLNFECFEHTNVKICIRGICFCSRAKDLLWFTLVQWVSSVNGVLSHNGTLGQDIVLFSEFPFNFNASVFFNYFHPGCFSIRGVLIKIQTISASLIHFTLLTFFYAQEWI